MAMAAEAMAAMISDRRPGAARDRREAPLTLANAGLVRGGCTELESRPKLARQGRGIAAHRSTATRSSQVDAWPRLVARRPLCCRGVSCLHLCGACPVCLACARV